MAVNRKAKQKIKNGFANSLKELGKCDILPYKIKLTSDEIVNIPQYRKSIVDHEYKNMLTKWKKQG